MQQFVAAVSRRKKALILAAVVAAGGYASYTYYNSESFQRRKRQVILLAHGLGKLLDTVVSLSDSAALVAGDLNGFLHSDADELPQSFKQLMKALRSDDFQELVVLSTSRLCKEVILGVAASTSPPRTEPRSSTTTTTTSSVGTSESSDRVVEFEPDKVCLRSPSTRRRSLSRQRRTEGLPERLLNKMFSEGGKGFASVVVGAAVRNLVMAFFEEMQRRSEFDSRDLVPETYELANGGGAAVRQVEPGAVWKPEALLDLACTTQGRSLIAECIQHFVEASLSTYLEKTRDINVFEEVVEAVTHPVHQVPAKEMIVSVCNEAVGTLVRTSYQVLSDASPRRRELGKTPSSTDHPEASLQRSNSESVVEKVFRALSAPTNRTLVIDLAGKVTSEAVRSFFGVLISVCRPSIQSSSSQVVVVSSQITGDVAAKVLVLMTICCAVILHVLANAGGAE